MTNQGENSDVNGSKYKFQMTFEKQHDSFYSRIATLRGRMVRHFFFVKTCIVFCKFTIFLCSVERAILVTLLLKLVVII
jgi:hypothetical protein